MAYLEGLGMVDDLEELNVLALLRHAHFITSMSEGEASGLLTALTSEGEDEDGQGEMKRVVHALVFARLAELNGPEAMRLAAYGELGEMWEDDEDDLAAIGMSSWVDADPEGAIKWFRGAALSDPKLRELLDDRSVQNSFFAAMARHDSEIALDLFKDADGLARTSNIEVIARYQPTVDAVEDLLNQQVEQSARDEVFEVLTDRNPTAAARWLEGQSGIPKRDEYVEYVASGLLNEDLDTGVEWYMKQDLGEDQQAERLETIVNHLAREDLSRAGEWLQEQGDSPNRDRAEIRLAGQLAGAQEWDESFQWVSEVGDSQRQRDGVERILRSGWDRTNESMDPAAESAAREAGFGDQVEEYVRKRTKRDD